MEAHLPRSEEARLLGLAARTGRGADDLVKEAVAKLLDHDDWFNRQVQIGMDQIARHNHAFVLVAYGRGSSAGGPASG